MPEEKHDWREAIAGMAADMARESYPSGDLAALRRLDVERRDASAFWLLLAKHASNVFDNEAGERAFAIVANGMAITFPFHRPNGRRSLGAAMADCGVTEGRLLRLLRSRSDQLPSEVRRLARLMASRGEDARFDWHDIFALAFYRKNAEAVRRQIAKSYYRQQYHLQKAEEEAA